MINSKYSAMGIIFPNTYDNMLPELVNVRLMASIPFASRYRLIDFVLSSMSNCGIDNIDILVKRNYHSLMDHLGSGREWDLVRKNGGLNIFPPYAMESSKPYTGRVEALEGIIGVLRAQKEDYVVMTDCNIAANLPFDEFVNAHIASGADVTIVYNEAAIPESLRQTEGNSKGYYYTLGLDGDKVTNIFVNPKKEGLQNFSLNIPILKRTLLIDLIDEAYMHGMEYFERDVLLSKLNKIDIRGLKYDGYVARITDMKSYFDENMKLLDDKNLDALFKGAPIYTKIRDDNPTRYISGAKAENVMVADGCVIEGEIENSILFRGVHVAKGAKVKNCILMQDTEVAPGAEIEYLITDKDVTISAGKSMKGTDTFPVYIAKFQKV